MHLNPNASRLAVFALVLIGALASLPRDAKLVAQTPARPPAPAARPADALITEALTKARAENKTVFIDFRASWCGPCGKLQTFLEAAGTGPVIQAHYVVVPLTVWEMGSMAALNNPGAEELLKKWGGSAIPFIVWLDKNGTKVADSQAFGFPTSVSDVRAFSALLEKTAPRITPPELQTVATYLIARGSGAGWAALSTRRSTADLSGWFFPALSADGRYLADTAFSGEDVILRDMVTGAERRIAHGNWEGADDEVEYPSDQPAFSRDGRQLAYSWTKGMKSGRCELRVVDIGGAEPGRSRTLVSGEDIAWIRAQDWTPDGQWIVVEFGIRDRTTHIGLASTRDGSLRVLKSFGPGALVDARWIVGAGYLTSHAAVAPDGKTLAFDRWTAGTRRDVFVVALDGTAERPAVVHPADDALVGWSGDGKTLLFTSDRTGSIGLWTVPVDGATFGPPTLVMANVGDAEFLLPSAAGALPYVLSAPLAGDVLLMRADFGAGAVTSPPANVADQFLGRNSDPRWSADGKLLAYVSRRDGVAGGRVLVVRSSDTGVVREMRPALAWFSLAAWVPDSRNVMVRGLGTDGRGWYRVNTDSGATSWIGDDAHGVAFRQFSADGSSMYVDGGPTNGTIAVIARDMASGTEREVFRGPQGFPNRLALSPNGRTLYYRQPVSPATPPHDLIARDLATGTERTLVRQRKLGPVQPSPDGRFIVTTSESASKDGSVLLLIPADGGDPRELPNVGDPATISNFLAWAPDSHSILTWRVAQNKETEYWWVPLDGRAPRKLAVPQRASKGWVAQPEGHDLAFEVQQNMDWPSLWIMELQSPAGAVKSTLPSVGRGSTPAKK